MPNRQNILVIRYLTQVRLIAIEHAVENPIYARYTDIPYCPAATVRLYSC